MTRAASVAPGCTITGCFGPHEARGLCHRHYERLRRNGAAGPAEHTRAPNGAGSITHQGYVTKYATGHPLARAQGKILEHRLVLFEKIGLGPHRCHWCSTPLNWSIGMRGPHDLVVDHVDTDTTNNDPANLVPSCNPCNVGRR